MATARKIITAAVCVFGALVLASLLIAGCSASQQQSTPKVSSISYTHQEAEVGDSTTYVLSRSTGAAVSLNIRQYPTPPGAQDVGETFEISESALDDIDGICERYNIFEWPEKAAKSEIAVADAEEFIFEITLDDGTSISFSNLDELPDGGDNAVRELSSSLESLVEID